MVSGQRFEAEQGSEAGARGRTVRHGDGARAQRDERQDKPSKAHTGLGKESLRLSRSAVQFCHKSCALHVRFRVARRSCRCLRL